MFRPLVQFAKPMKLTKPTFFTDKLRMEEAIKANTQYVATIDLKDDKNTKTIGQAINK